MTNLPTYQLASYLIKYTLVSSFSLSRNTLYSSYIDYIEEGEVYLHINILIIHQLPNDVSNTYWSTTYGYAIFASVYIHRAMT